MSSPHLSILFERALPHGICVGVEIAEKPSERPALRFSDDEIPARGIPEGRRTSWLAGRAALRSALARLGAEAEVIPADERGAPVLPSGLVGSISHKTDLAVAMAAEDSGWTLGVDIERRSASKTDISRRVLTSDEHRQLSELDPAERAVEVMLRFSIKEAVYKAIDPFLRRYVGFREVSVHPRGDGIATVHHRLEPPLEVEARWTTTMATAAGEDGYFLSSARARRR